MCQNCLKCRFKVSSVVVCFLLGYSPASEFYVPTFRNTLFHLHPPMKMEQTECSETSSHKNSDAGELPRKKDETFRTRRKFEIQNKLVLFVKLPICFNSLNPELNPICYLLALLRAHHFLHVSRIMVKLLTLRRLMSCIYGAPILDVYRSHTTTQHSR